MKCLLAVLSAGNARGPSSWTGRTEAGASNIVTCDRERSSAGLVTGFLVTMALATGLVCKYRAHVGVSLGWFSANHSGDAFARVRVSCSPSRTSQPSLRFFPVPVFHSFRSVM